MIGESELERRLERTRIHHDEEPAFLRALLDAVVHAHVPSSDDHPRLRFLQFRHPDGFDAIPFFTSLEKARPPAGISARIVSITGRQFLEATRGATVMLNPNDGGCVLYPEEIAALLESGTVAHVEMLRQEAETLLLIMDQANPPAWLIPALVMLYTGLPFVEVAYLLEVAPPERPEQHTLLIAVGVAKKHAERAARATITMVQSTATAADMPIDLISFDPNQDLPDCLQHPGAKRFFGLAGDITPPAGNGS